MITVILPMYHHHLGAAVLNQLHAQHCSHELRVICVDNRGGFPGMGGIEVLQPGENLRYLRANNLGLRHATTTRPPRSGDLFVCMNDDIILSERFLDNLAEVRHLDFWQPVYDDINHLHLCSTQMVHAESYEPEPVDYPVHYIDGTVMAIPAETLARIGLFDDRHFGTWAWGDASDYSIRCAQRGLYVGATRRAFVNHMNHHSYRLDGSEPAYIASAGREMHDGMEAKYGWDWISYRDEWGSGERVSLFAGPGRLAVITPCSRPGNLGHLLPSVRQARRWWPDLVWMIMLDRGASRRDIAKDVLDCPWALIMEVPCPGSIVGNGQRDRALALALEKRAEWMHFLDDDNLMHPSWAWRVGAAVKDDPDLRMVVTGQERPKDRARVHGAHPCLLKRGCIDTAQVTVRTHVAAAAPPWMAHNDRCADGWWIEGVAALCRPDEVAFIDEPLCWHNRL